LKRREAPWPSRADGGHRVASAISSRPPPDLLAIDPAKSGLGERCYQIERSAASSLTAVGGAVPSPVRTEFLADAVIPRLRGTAKVLLAHGFGHRRQPQWNERTAHSASAFLGKRVTITWQQPRLVDGSWLELHDHHDRRFRFIWCRGLNSNVSGTLVNEVRRLVLERAPET
jgi:hypothetical protein